MTSQYRITPTTGCRPTYERWRSLNNALTVKQRFLDLSVQKSNQILAELRDRLVGRHYFNNRHFLGLGPRFLPDLRRHSDLNSDVAPSGISRIDGNTKMFLL